MSAAEKSFVVSRWQVAFVMDCNLRCSYCSTSFGTCGVEKGHMSRKVWEKFIDFSLNNIPENKKISFDFGVGETFLFFNEFLEIVKQIKSRAEQKEIGVDFSVVTNGTLLDKKKLDLLASEDISLTFSIDGPKDIHDKCRKDMKGSGSFEIAIKNWKYYKRLFDRKAFKGMCNIASVLTDDFSLSRLVEFWKEKGVDFFSCSIQLPGNEKHNCSKKEWRNRQDQYIDQLKEHGLKIGSISSVPHFLSDYKGPGDLFFMWRRQFLEQEVQPCGAGVDVAAVDINGNIYPCDTFIKSKNQMLGNIFEGFTPESVQLFSKLRNKALAICKDCHIKSSCPKNCFGGDPQKDIIQNFKDGCNFAKGLVDVSNETFRVLNKKNNKVKS